MQSVPGCIKLCFTRMSNGTGWAKSDDRFPCKSESALETVSCFRICCRSPCWVAPNTLLWTAPCSRCNCCVGTTVTVEWGCWQRSEAALGWVAAIPPLCGWRGWDLGSIWVSLWRVWLIVEAAVMGLMMVLITGGFRCLARLGKAAEMLVGTRPLCVRTPVDFAREGFACCWLLFSLHFSTNMLNLLVISFCCTQHCRSCFCFAARFSSCLWRDWLSSTISCWEWPCEREAWAAASFFLAFWLARLTAFNCRSISAALSRKLSTAVELATVPACEWYICLLH